MRAACHALRANLELIGARGRALPTVIQQTANAWFTESRAFGLANSRGKLLKQLGIGANDIALASKNVIASLEICDQTT